MEEPLGLSCLELSLLEAQYSIGYTLRLEGQAFGITM